MNLSEQFHEAFPELEDIVILAERPTDRRLRSLWLGFSQMVLNMPRIVITATIGSAVTVGASALALAWFVTMQMIVRPVVMLFTMLFLGIFGRLADRGDPVSRSQVTGAFNPDDFYNLPWRKGKGSVSADDVADGKGSADMDGGDK